VIRVVLADDDLLVRGGLRVLIGAEPDLEVAGEAADGREAVAVCRRLVPDVVLMDVRMPGQDGIAATRRLVAAGVPSRVLVLTTFEHDEYVFGALRAGASGFLLKRVEPAVLLDAVRLAARGDALVLPELTRALIERHVAPPDARHAGRLSLLSARERTVLERLAAGRSNAEIAGELVVGTETVKTHVSRILDKLGARDRTQAVIAAYEGGLVRPGRT
jgi:DNA-binding NarL/FixJ family response regulator